MVSGLLAVQLLLLLPPDQCCESLSIGWLKMLEPLAA
jgi:hypothetical protein